MHFRPSNNLVADDCWHNRGIGPINADPLDAAIGNTAQQLTRWFGFATEAAAILADIVVQRTLLSERNYFFHTSIYTDIVYAVFSSIALMPAAT